MGGGLQIQAFGEIFATLASCGGVCEKIFEEPAVELEGELSKHWANVNSWQWRWCQMRADFSYTADLPTSRLNVNQ